VSKELKQKLIGEAIAVIVAVVIALITPPEQLTRESMIVLGVLAWAVINWVVQLIDDYVVAIAMCTLWYALKAVTLPVAFNGFSSSTWWILIGALAIGTAVSKSGLLKRVSLYALKLFPPTYKGQIMAMLGAGTVAAPLIPSTTAKCAITAPIAMGIADQLGLPKQGSGRTGMYSAMYIGFSLNGVIFVSASFLGYTMLGALPAEVSASYTWLKWFIAMIPWAIVLLIGSYLFITRIYKPETTEKLPPNHIKDQLDKLGPWSRNEKIVAGVLLGCLVFWIGESYLGIAAVIPTLLGMCILFATKVIDKKDFQSKMLWSLMFFIGCAMSLGGVLGEVGVNAWLKEIIGPLVQTISNPYLLVFAMAVIVYFLRIVVTSLSASIIIFTTVFYPVAQAAGMDPWIAGMVVYCSTMVWYLRYQNANYLSAFAATGGDDMVKYNDTIKMSFGYMAISLIGLLVSVPYWQMLGMIR
jgi:DASS family divalent anion:Na+ symporter